jgi:hypothetical protein
MSSSEDEECKEESSDDVPMSSLRDSDDKRNKRRASQVNYAEEDDDFDDEDDVPLSALASPSPKKKKTVSSSSKKASSSKKSSTKTSLSARDAPATSTNSSTTFKSASDALYGSECDKGLLIQRLLCRWWYAIEWPEKSVIPEEPPENFDPLDGFLGVFVCTEGDEVGAIKDFRNRDTCPNFINMANKPAEELQALLIKALTEQKRQLVEAEGEGTETQKALDQLLKWTKKVNVTTADSKAAAVLKAAKFSLH